MLLTICEQSVNHISLQKENLEGHSLCSIAGMTGKWKSPSVTTEQPVQNAVWLQSGMSTQCLAVPRPHPAFYHLPCGKTRGGWTCLQTCTELPVMLGNIARSMWRLLSNVLETVAASKHKKPWSSDLLWIKVERQLIPVMWHPLFWWHSIQLGSNAALKSAIFTKDQKMGKINHIFLTMKTLWWNLHQTDALLYYLMIAHCWWHPLQIWSYNYGFEVKYVCTISKYE